MFGSENKMFSNWCYFKYKFNPPKNSLHDFIEQNFSHHPY